MTSKIASKPPKKDSKMEDTTEYLSIKLAAASKTGQRASGQIHYRILTDSTHTELFLMLVGNDGAGYYSKERVAFSELEHCLSTLNEKAFPSKVFQPAYVSRSINNSGFACCCLRAEGLLKPVPDKVHLHQLSGDWKAFKAEMLKLPVEAFTTPSAAMKETENIPDSPQPIDQDATMSTNQSDDLNDPIALLTSKKQRRLPETKHQHPSSGE